ncbi:MAG: DotU family type IV/VI secretion system protein [Lentisphaerae bacterium]|nr:DotU family type IV/VI secretion system protein [Lentisphaerota bacterium]MCP4100671.1 DotU family type IV/VI secretion system protein [Lentisphaerota bacterium]
MIKLDIWDKITELFLFLEESKSTLLPEILNDAEKVIEFRSNLRARINVLSEMCDKELGVKTNYFILFPIIVFCDEIISIFFAENNVNWPKMQKEIYDIQDGGEKYYELLEQTLEQPTFPELVYQLNYLILQYGFKGQLVDSNIKKTRNYYISKLEAILKTFHIPEEASKQSMKIFSDKISFWELVKENCIKYYFLPAAFVVLVFYVSTIWVLNLVLR